ncbi:MAG: hypothetical protein CMJ54_12355 [Planctomycetaceae bacterium]|nr:hypothetical protein [Planctomycetaceae bacterium]
MDDGFQHPIAVRVRGPDPTGSHRRRRPERRVETDGPMLGPSQPDSPVGVNAFKLGGLADFEAIGPAAESEGGYDASVIGCLGVGLEQPVEMRWGTFRSRRMSENRRSEHCEIDPAQGQGVIAAGTTPPYHGAAGAVASSDLASPIAQESS